jgi:hypothetical protein
MDYVDFMEEMRVFDADTSAVPQLGIFWFDEDSESLFEVHTKAFDPDRVVNGLLLYTKTHEFWWEKARSASCNRSSSLYSKCFNEVPRGRVTFADGMFINSGSRKLRNLQFRGGIEPLLFFVKRYAFKYLTVSDIFAIFTA